MRRFAFAALLAGLAGLTGLATVPVLAGCGSSSSDGDGTGSDEETAYPYICACNCHRCIERAPSTGACVRMGRQDFVAPACAVDDDEATGACGDACGRFGTECTWTAGERASATPCQ